MTDQLTSSAGKPGVRPRMLVTSPPGWSGSEVAASEPWLHVLTAVQVEEIEAAMTAARDAGDGHVVDRASFVLPTLADAAASWRAEVAAGRGFLVLRGLPVERWTLEEAEIAFLGLGSHLGVPQPQNAAGDLVAHVRAERPDGDPSARRYETSEDTPFHTDGSDMIALFCLRQGRSGGQSAIVSSATVVNTVHARRPDLTALLFEPWPFAMTADATEHFEVPLVSSTEPLSFFYIRWYIEQSQAVRGAPALTPAHLELLDLIDATAAEARLDIDFAPGDVQLLSNRTVMHARTTFEDWDEPERRRHLLRLWLQRSETGR